MVDIPIANSTTPLARLARGLVQAEIDSDAEQRKLGSGVYRDAPPGGGIIAAAVTQAIMRPSGFQVAIAEQLGKENYSPQMRDAFFVAVEEYRNLRRKGLQTSR